MTDAELDKADIDGTALDGTALDNAVWYSLRGAHRDLARDAGDAVRYGSAWSPFAAVPDAPGPAAWSALASLTDGRAPVVLFRDRVALPDGWTVAATIPGIQLTGDGLAGRTSDEAVPLADADADEVLDLVERTKPGPFRPRTMELGTYVGIRSGGRLVAMAGERLRLDGRREISAVCTDPEHRGRGLAGSLVEHLVANARAHGDETFLHVASDNLSAKSLYETLGFVVRREVDAVVAWPPGMGPG